MGRRLHGDDDEIVFAGFHFGGEYIFSNYHAAYAWGLFVILAKPPPGQHERQRQRSSVARGLDVIARSPSSLLRRPSTAAKYGKSAAALLDSWFPDAPARVAVVDLALKYARHLRDAPLAGADRNTSLEMTANPV